ncbi:MAG: glutathione S-transferase family protein [Hahellaceae bacterium]|nr:glutathione S-transferase family protein [Hahellaceae bacterium]MCP5209992.1 glutathione S-transferase family protein [Hahellaceae bacterium]
MGILIKGQWVDQWYQATADGEFVRETAKLRHWITPDGSAGPTGSSGFTAESGRYHLYVSLACPWAHRTLIFRQLKQLQNHITVSVVATDMLADGWTFDKANGSTGDHLYDKTFLYQLYTHNIADYSGRVTVPVLWDKKQQCIVNNESAEIIRMFNHAFNAITGNKDDYYPERLRASIDDINETIYENINNGVYRAGFASTQAAYDQAYHKLFTTLDSLESLLARRRYLLGGQITEADWRLFTTLIRFDSVYHGHFKCNRQRLEDFPHLANYLRELYQLPGIASTVNFDHIKRHYYYSHQMINPSRIIPQGPDIDYQQPHNRGATKLPG